MLPFQKRERRVLRSWDDISDFKNINTDKPCFILGSGPSVAFLNLECINKFIVITINSSIMLMDWSENKEINNRFWLSNDVLCMKWSYFNSHVLKYKCQKLVGAEWQQHAKKLAGHDFRFFSPRITQGKLLETELGLCTVSSVPSAIDFALFMGCKKIFLLGVDQRIVQKKSHFWQFWDKSRWPQRVDQHKNFQPEQPHQLVVFKKNYNTFKVLNEYASKNGKIIKNCSLRSSLDIFDKISLEQAVDEAAC